MIQSQEKRLWKKIGSLKVPSQEKESVNAEAGHCREISVSFLSGISKNNSVSENRGCHAARTSFKNQCYLSQNLDNMNTNPNLLFTVQEDLRQFSFNGGSSPSPTSPFDHCHDFENSSNILIKQQKWHQTLLYIKSLQTQVSQLQQELKQFKCSLTEQLSKTKQFFEKISFFWSQELQEVLTKLDLTQKQNQVLEENKFKESLQKEEMRKYVERLEEQNNELMLKLDETLEKYLKQFGEKEQLKNYNIQLEKTLLEKLENSVYTLSDSMSASKNFEDSPKRVDRKISKYENQLNFGLQRILHRKQRQQISKCSTFHSMFANSQRDSKYLGKYCQYPIKCSDRLLKMSMKVGHSLK